MPSTADIAKRLGCTVQAVNKYRRRVEDEVGQSLGRPDPSDRRRVIFTDDEAEQISAMAPQVARIDDAEVIDGPDVEVLEGPRGSSLALRHSTLPALQRRGFDLVSARQDIDDLEIHTARIAQRADSVLSGFATARMVQAAANIERTIATLEANALGDALHSLGKSAAPTDTAGTDAAA
jgi:hypothetical protein